MSKICLAAAFAVALIGKRNELFARAGQLKSPSIALAAREIANVESPAEGLLRALKLSKDQFVNGRYINANTTMEFQGDSKSLNELLERLAAVDGAAVKVRFSRPGRDLALIVDQPAAAAEEEGDAKHFHWTVSHNAWLDPNALTVTIQIGEKSPIDEIDIPVFRRSSTKPAKPADDRQ